MKLRIWIALYLMFASFAVSSTEAVLLAPHQVVAGKTQEEWSKLWWQWAASFDYEESPVADRTGRNCGAKQEGAVWFLAGTYGTQRTIRACKVPAGKHLFFPLINYVTYSTPMHPRTCRMVEATAAGLTDDVGPLILDVNGMRFTGLEKHRLATRKCFDLGTKIKPQVSVFPAAANGYYVMLKPLPPGQYTLNFGGVLPGMMQAVTYSLIVE